MYLLIKKKKKKKEEMPIKLQNTYFKWVKIQFTSLSLERSNSVLLNLVSFQFQSSI